MNHINLRKDKLVITFKFDSEIVDAIKTIDGRVWMAKEKHWEIPKENVFEVLDALVPLGFTLHVDVLNLRDHEEDQIARINEVRRTGEGYSGTLPLRDFQKIGASFIKQMPSCLLGDVPGLGKTIQTIAGTEHEDQILILVPATLKFNWYDEILKWVPKADIIVVNGNKKIRAELWDMAARGFYRGGVRVIPKYVVANYELLLHDFSLIDVKEWPVIVADEATRISNPSAQTTKNLKKLRSRKRVPLTGTPISNSPDDIYSLIDWIAPRYLGTFFQFKKKYCLLGEFNRVVGYQHLDQLSEKIGRFMLRRTKEEVFTDFPAKTIEYVRYDLPEKEKDMYTAIKNQVLDEIKKLGELDTSTLALIPVKMLRLKQCTDHTRLVEANGQGESSKLELLKEMLPPIVSSGEKAIVFTQFAEMLHIMEEELQKFRPLFIHGGVDNEKRIEIVKEFNEDPEGRIIVMTEAGAYGLNMQSASYVFHYDAPWSLAKLEQREGRAHRMGQTKPVTVYHLIAKGTIDEYILKTLEKKGKVSENILKDADRIEDNRLTKNEIKEILGGEI